MPQGRVTWFSGKKGFGFIAPDTGGGDVFVHHSSIEAASWQGLEVDQRVEFDIMKGNNGLQAKHVRTL